MTLKMGPMGYPETSVRNYRYLLRNNPELRNSQYKSEFHIMIILLE
jgi:hypothetical protein